jgi:hypothetical protein
MVPFTVVVGLELGKRTVEVPLSERNEALKAFLFDGTDEPLRVCAAVRRPERYPYDPHTSRFEDASNGGTPLAITVADQKSRFLQQTVGICHLPRNLEHECFVRMRRTGHDLDAPRVEFDHEDRVVRDEAAERPHLGREEVRRHERSPMRSPLGGMPSAFRTAAMVDRATR